MNVRIASAILLFVVLIHAGCSEKQSGLSITDGTPTRTLSEVNEELLISQTSDLDDLGDRLIITERANSRFLLLDKDFRDYTAVGQRGRGPGDLAYPTKLDTYNGKIYVYERDNRRISVFDDGGTFKRSHSIEEANTLVNFEVLNDSTILYASDLGGKYLVRQNLESGDVSRHGDVDNTEAGFIKRKKNIGFVFGRDGGYVFVNPFRLHIKLYDNSFNLLHTHEMREDSYFQEAIVPNEQLPPNTVRSYVSDVVLQDGKLYMNAYYQQGGGEKSLEHFLQYDLGSEKVTLQEVYHLTTGDAYYPTFHVSGGAIYAYNIRSGDLHVFE